MYKSTGFTDSKEKSALMSRDVKVNSSRAMTGTSQAEDQDSETELDPDNDRFGMADNDQYFLLFFIMGTYFGPDIEGENPQKPILQRIAEGLPSYTTDELVGSHMKIAEIEQVFRYVLRRASQSVKAVLPLLSQFCNGSLPRIGEEQSPDYPQFPDLFPLELHPHKESEDGDMVIENIGFTSDPEVYYLGLDDVERFRRLSGLEDFFLDAEVLRLHSSCVEVNGLNCELSAGKSEKTRCLDELLGQGDHAMVLLPSIPTKSELSNLVSVSKSGFALAGSAAKGKLGSSIGLMDIGECDDSYLFRISLPGVKRDARDFSCEVESNGKVVIRGVSSVGEKMVYRYSHMFVMQTQNLCPSGRFSISFKLPGPVDPQQFSGNFDTDGILEGIIMKDRSLTGR